MRSWTPTAQAQHAFLVTHNESISIADFFTLRENGKVVYRPTCHYAYHPCDDAVLSLHEMAGAAWQMQSDWRILGEGDIVDGIDELGVLLYGHAKNAYWYGSQLSVEETRELAPYQNATGLQVTSAVLAGTVWMLENPDRGIVEADELDFRRCLEVQRPYLGSVIGRYTDWTPADGRGGLFPDEVDRDDPWQFSNVLVRSWTRRRKPSPQCAPRTAVRTCSTACRVASRFQKTAERLREGPEPSAGLSFVAERNGDIVGTVSLWDICAGPGRHCCWPVSGHPDSRRSSYEPLNRQPEAKSARQKNPRARLRQFRTCLWPRASRVSWEPACSMSAPSSATRIPGTARDRCAVAARPLRAPSPAS